MSALKKEGTATEDKNKLKRATKKTKKENLESICDEVMGF